MTALTLAFPKAFGIWFKELRAWSVGSFFDVGWHWPTEFIRPLSDALNKKHVEVDLKQHPFDSLTLATLHFDGTMEPRDLRGKNTFKGRLHFADAGDVVYSKIDVRNGAIGIVPDEMKRVAVSSEYPVYSVLPNVALAEYIRLVFRTRYFRQAINSMISGASGRKRVQPKQIESLAIPLPPLDVQRAIVARWQQARQAIAEAEERIKQLESGLPQTILKKLGIPLRESAALPRVFMLTWKDLDRWSVNYLARTKSSASDLHKSKYPLLMLGDLAQVSYGVQKSPANRPGKNARPYLRVANVQKGQLDLSEIKYIDVSDVEMEALRLKRGDLLVCEGNSADLVGRPAMWNDEILDCVHQNHILKVRVDQNVAVPEYILEYMQTQPARNFFRARAKFTTNLASINSNDLRELQIPLPPLDVQRDLMHRVAEGRAEIAREREIAQQRACDIEAEIEALILGTRTIY